MTDNTWLSQPAATPYPTADPTVVMIAKALVAAYGEDADKDCPCEQDWDVARGLAPLLAEAERRGAEKGWESCAAWFAYRPQHDYGPEHRVKGVVVSAADEANPYRKEA